MKDRFRATRAFWRSFGKLPAQQQRRAREAFLIFKQNPFDSRLGSHKSKSFLLAMSYVAGIEANLRVVFYIEGGYNCNSRHRLARSVSLSVVYTERGDNIRIIGARVTSRRERRNYEEGTQKKQRDAARVRFLKRCPRKIRATLCAGK